MCVTRKNRPHWFSRVTNAHFFLFGVLMAGEHTLLSIFFFSQWRLANPLKGAYRHLLHDTGIKADKK